jgi:glutamate transport system permease protein
MSLAVLADAPGPRARHRQRIGGALGVGLAVLVLALVVWRLWSRGQFDANKWDPFADPDIQRGIAQGVVATLRVAFFSVLLALGVGALLAVGRLSERAFVRAPVVAFIEFFRAVPLLLLILFLFIGFGDTLGAFWSLVLALILYNGSVLAEIFRAGILAVPRGQSEAAYAIGLRKSQVMTLVLVPQAVRTMLPAITSQCVVALKDSALGFVIGYQELTRTGRLIYDGYFNIIPTALVIAAVYIAINYTLSKLAEWLERRQARQFGAKAVQQVEAATDIH